MTRSHAPVRDLDFACPYPSRRAPVMGRNVVAASQPLAAQAGLRMLLKGGNAVDAALAAAMTLTVVEPSGCGLGSDGFAIVWDGKALHGLNGSGRAPAAWTPEYFAGHTTFPERGWDSVTVPGAVSTWVALSKRFGKLPFATLAEPAIHYARHGHMVAPAIADIWRRAVPILGKQPGFAECFLPEGRALRAGEVFKSEAMAKSLEAIVATEGEAFYRGALAEKIAAFAKTHGGAMTADDLAAHEVEWYSTITKPYAGAVVHELPPNGQGIATLMGLGMLEALGVGEAPVDSIETLHLAIESAKLAYADLYHYVSDADFMRVTPAELIDPAYLADRAKLIDRRKAGAPNYGSPRSGGTVYLTAADESGMMISFIQSNYEGFGSGVVVSGTGISLQNRGFGFTLEKGHANEVAPRKRPFHTIIPGFVTTPDGEPLMSFGLMGGAMQAQGHLQMMLRVLRYGQNPQAAADAPRWRITGGRTVSVEPSMNPATVDGLKALGHEITVQPTDSGFSFGGAQLIMKGADGYIAGSDPRKDGQAVTY